MAAKWLVPTLVYILCIGSLGVTSKLALRTLAWQDLLLWTTAGYIATAGVLLALGQTAFTWQPDVGWAILSAGLAIGALIFLYLALGSGEASKVIPVSAAYPAVTLVLSALTLAESVSLPRIGGMLLVIAGVVVLTSVE